MELPVYFESLKHLIIRSVSSFEPKSAGIPEHKVEAFKKGMMSFAEQICNVLDQSLSDLDLDYKSNNPQPKRLNYSSLACEEGLALLGELFGGNWMFEENFEESTVIKFWDKELRSDNRLYSDNGDWTRMERNWQLILAKPRQFKGELVYFLPDGFEKN